MLQKNLRDENGAAGKKVIADIKKLTKEGQVDAVKIMAKDKTVISSNSISDGLTDRHTGDLHLCCFRPYTMTQQDCRAQSPDIHLVLQRS
ncbi:hypothetical protein DMENIID0001_030030 [Sergentomyia squamirostris]